MTNLIPSFGVLVNGPQKPASLTTGSFRPVVESLDLTPREAGAIPPASMDLTVGPFSPRTRWFIGVSVILHCVVLTAVFGLSRPDALPPAQEIAFEIIVQDAAPTAVGSVPPAGSASPAVAESAPVSPAPVLAAQSDAQPPELAQSDTPAADEPGGVTIVGRAPETPVRIATVEKTTGRAALKLASANPAGSVERAIRLDVPTFVLSPALRARPLEKAAPLGRLAFASAAQIVVASATDADPVLAAEIAAATMTAEPEQPLADVGEAPGSVALSSDVADGPAVATTTDPRPSSPIRLPGTSPDVTGTLPPAAPDASSTVLAVAAHEPGSSATPIPAMVGTAAPELVPFPPGPEDEAAAREAAAHRATLARQAEMQRARRTVELKAAEAHARALKEAKEAKLAAMTSREWRIKVARRIHDFQSYPENVRQRGFEGTVQLSFTVDAAGAVVSRRILKSSGDPELDQEGLDAVQRASPFPAPPPNTSRIFTAPFAYRLR